MANPGCPEQGSTVVVAAGSVVSAVAVAAEAAAAGAAFVSAPVVCWLFPLTAAAVAAVRAALAGRCSPAAVH